MYNDLLRSLGRGKPRHGVSDHRPPGNAQPSPGKAAESSRCGGAQPVGPGRVRCRTRVRGLLPRADGAVTPVAGRGRPREL